MCTARNLKFVHQHISQGDKSKNINLSMSSIVESVRSLQGGDPLPSSYEPPPEAFEIQEVSSEDIPIMPLVVKTLFISNASGENISNIRKLLYKVRKSVSLLSGHDFCF